MEVINYCPCCLSTNIEKYPSILFNFVIDRSLKREKISDSDTDCNSIFCLDCSFICCDIRFNQEEEENYNFEYGHGDYVDHRLKYEPFIRSTFENYNSETMTQYRKQNLQNFFSNFLLQHNVRSILDFGGADGKLIPKIRNDGLHFVRYVHDIANLKLADNVINLPQDKKVDMVMCCQTLEHVSFPDKIIKLIKNYLKPAGILYVEVPNEPRNRGRNQFHEHINLYNLESISKLVNINGFLIKKVEEKFIPHYCTSFALLCQLT